jgi:hypothetical protein
MPETPASEAQSTVADGVPPDGGEETLNGAVTDGVPPDGGEETLEEDLDTVGAALDALDGDDLDAAEALAESLTIDPQDVTAESDSV